VTLLGPAGRALESTQLPISGRLLEQLVSHSQAPLLGRAVCSVVGLPLAPGVTALLRRARLIGLQTSDKDLREMLDQVARVDPTTASSLAVSCQRHSAQDLLPTLKVPLLIITAGRDPFMPPTRVALPMHRAAPGSELVNIEGATHAALLDFPDQIARDVDDFLRRRVAPFASSRAALVEAGGPCSSGC
jgi:pimeloyl-ACP methyl ester carboxylesterase